MSDEGAVEAAADLIVQGDRGDCECRRSSYDKHEANPPCSTRRRAIRIARAALEVADPYLAATVQADALENFATFIENPLHPGLDHCTLREVAAEARHRAESLRGTK